MNILILTCNIGIPLIMIFIGGLYKHNSYKKIDSTLDLIMPLATTFVGISYDEAENFSKNKNKLDLINRKCSSIWIVTGIGTLLLTIVLLLLNKTSIHYVSILLLEIQCIIFVSVFVTIEYILKMNFRKSCNR